MDVSVKGSVRGHHFLGLGSFLWFFYGYSFPFLGNHDFSLHIDLSSSDVFHITTLTPCTTLEIQPLWL